MGLYERVVNRFLGNEITRQVREALAAAETDNSFVVGSRGWNTNERDRPDYDRSKVLEQALEAWRVNPLARRIVNLTTQYVIGDGLIVESPEKESADFLKAFWNNRLNRMGVRCSEWCDELTRTGNLFILVSTDAAGMSYVRAITAGDIEQIESQPNDVEQALAYTPKGCLADPHPQPYPAYAEQKDQVNGSGEFETVMLHYTVNRPVGAQWGESDLAPLLRWLARYANWLEDRARLNRFRTAFLYVVKGKFKSEAERIARQRSLNTNPPQPGSILVTDESETWEVLSPHLDSQEANTDGLALKKMIASGAGIPLHFLAEPESATRTTATAAGMPTYRHYEQRQNYFLWIMEDLLRVVLRRRAQVDRRVKAESELSVTGQDISARDNVSLALAATNIVAAMGKMRNRGLIDDAEFLRLVYRFTGEMVDVEAMLERGEKAGPILDPKFLEEGKTDVSLPINPETGELSPKAVGEGS